MSIASRINAIEEHIGNAYDKLEDLGIDLTNTDKNIDNIATKLEEVYDEYPKVTGTGTEVTLNNTKAGKMKIKPNGNTSQNTTTQSANLFDEEYYNNSSLYSYQSAYTYVLTKIKGARKLWTKCILKSGKTSINGLYLCVCSSYSPNVSPNTNCWLVNNGNINSNYEGDFTNYTDIYFTYYPNTVTVNQIFDTYNIMISTDNVNYVPFVPDSPSPDYPQTIHKVSGNNTVKIQNKILFDETQLLEAENWTKNSEGYYNGTISNFYNKWKDNGFNVSIDGTKQHILKLNYYVTGGSAILRFVYNDNTYTGITLNSTTATDITLLSTEGKTITKIIGTYASGGSNTLYIKNIQLEQGSTATDYVAHAEQNLPINLGDIELCKIGTAQDYFYYNSGKWYIHKEIGKVVLDSNIVINYNSTAGQFYTVNQVILPNYKLGTELLSNYFKYSSTSWTPNCMGVTSTNTFWLYIENGPVGVPALQTWLSTHNTEVLYELLTPTNTEITETTLINQLEAIRNAKSYNEQTNISQTNNDLPFILDLAALRGE